MNNIDLYTRIYDIAKRLYSHNNRFTRADLAFELKDLGVLGDSIRVSELAFRAYTHFKDSKEIRNSFLTNDSGRLLVDEYQVNHLLDTGKEHKAMNLLQEHLKSASEALGKIPFIELQQGVQLPMVDSQLLLKVVGSGKSSQIQQQAAQIMQHYSQMIASYEQSKDSVRGVIVDFVFVRERILELYRSYSYALVDIFGDSIKQVAPELFDFEEIQWLDTSAMEQHVNLEYEKLSSSCSLLIQEIGDGFQNTLQNSISGLRVAKTRQLGMVLGGLNLLNHYAQAAEKTNRLSSEFQILKTKIRQDAALVSSDVARLLVVYQTLDRVFIPKAEFFYKNAQDFMSEELTELLDSVYSTKESKALKQKRDQILVAYKAIEESIKDHELNSSYYKGNIQSKKILLDQHQSGYETAQRLKPKKPFFLLNLLSFGSLQSSYQRDAGLWHSKYAHVIKGYQELKTDLELDTQELHIHSVQSKEKIKELQLKSVLLTKINTELRNTLVSDDQLKHKVMPHLNTYVGLLRIAKEILEGSLDDKLMQTTKIESFNELKLPKQISDKLESFKSQVYHSLAVDQSEAIQGVDWSQSDVNSDKVQVEKNQVAMLSKENQQQLQGQKVLDASYNQVLESGINWADSWVKLQKLKYDDAQAAAHYKDQVSQMQEEFKCQMDQVQDKAQVLQALIASFTNVVDKDQRKEVFLQLSDLSGYSLTTKQVQDLIEGKTQLIL